MSMSLTDAQDKYTQEPRYRDFVDWFAGLIQSGTMTCEAAIYAAVLAADKAETNRRKIPVSNIPAGTMPDGSSKLKQEGDGK